MLYFYSADHYDLNFRCSKKRGGERTRGIKSYTAMGGMQQMSSQKKLEINIPFQTPPPTFLIYNQHYITLGVKVSQAIIYSIVSWFDMVSQRITVKL